MESSTALKLCIDIYKKSERKVFLEKIVSDDDSTMRVVLKHPKFKKREPTVPLKNSVGKLPTHIPEPKWLADPSHRCKVVASAIYALSSKSQKLSMVNKLDAMKSKNILAAS